MILSYQTTVTYMADGTTQTIESPRLETLQDAISWGDAVVAKMEKKRKVDPEVFAILGSFEYLPEPEGVRP